MKKFLMAIALLLSSANIADSKVNFIANPQPDGDNASFASFSVIKNDRRNSGSSESSSTDFQCTSTGYTRTRCGDGFYLSGRCPQNPKYYRTCCGNDYQLTKEECLNKGGEPGPTGCDGKYTCSL